MKLKPMIGRSHTEDHRAATTLELLYDLSFVVVLSVCGIQLAHAATSGHLLPGVVAFLIAQLAAIWAWMSYTWFTSGFDTNDWGVRLAVGLQMVGVIIFATGIPEFFEGMSTWQLQGRTMVMGYIVIRVAMVLLWFRVARSTPGDPYGGYQHSLWTILIQAGWTITLVSGGLAKFWFIFLPLLWLLELIAPIVIATKYRNIPFHPHHLTERFGLLTIISLGEIVVGTAGATTTLYQHHGWAWSTVIMVATGISLALSLWWIYFEIPFARALYQRPSGFTLFSYMHIGIFMMIAAIGAGIHVAAEAELNESKLNAVETIAMIAIPNVILLVLLYIITFGLIPMRTTNRKFHSLLFLVTVGLLITAIAMATMEIPVTECLALIVFAPIVQIIGIELHGRTEMLDSLSTYNTKSDATSSQGDEEPA